MGYSGKVPANQLWDFPPQGLNFVDGYPGNGFASSQNSLGSVLLHYGIVIIFKFSQSLFFQAAENDTAAA